jgi:tRNA1Val (adenine37-N6)-methyltransferase
MMRSYRYHNIELKPDESIDDFMDGRLRLIQSKTGYRFSIDAILLSEFATIKKGDIITDFGSGCGIIPLILLLTRPVGYVIGLEIQKELADQAARNSILNDFSDRMSVILCDIKQSPLTPASVDVVVCNPPYRRADSGRINPDQQRAIARHEILASIDDILSGAKNALKSRGGRLAMIYPADRLADLMMSMRQYNLEPKRIRIIYPNADSEAKLALVEGVSGGNSGVKILPPLFDQGSFSIPKNPD